MQRSDFGKDSHHSRALIRPGLIQINPKSILNLMEIEIQLEKWRKMKKDVQIRKCNRIPKKTDILENGSCNCRKEPRIRQNAEFKNQLEFTSFTCINDQHKNHLNITRFFEYFY